MSKVQDKIEKVVEDIGEIKVVLGRLEVLHERNTISLEEHIKRTNALEEIISSNQKSTDDQLEPIKKHISMVKGAIWILGVVGTVFMALYEMGIIQKLL